MRPAGVKQLRQLHPDKNTECEEDWDGGHGTRAPKAQSPQAAKHAFQKLMEERHAPSN